jgi:hypothetical protein
MKIIKLSQRLQLVLDRLERATTQDFREFQTDSGDTRRSASSSPYEVLQGKVEVDESTVAEIKNVRPGIYSGTYRGAQMHFSPMTYRVATQSITSDGRSTYEIEIKVRIV